MKVVHAKRMETTYFGETSTFYLSLALFSFNVLLIYKILMTFADSEPNKVGELAYKMFSLIRFDIK